MNRPTRALLRPAALTALAAAGFVAATVGYTPVAAACGGFFCNTSAPVDQAGEQILFAVHEGFVEAHVQVQYTGPSEDFAWIVPTPSMPEVGVSSAAVFQRLEQLLAPRFQLNWQYLGDCGWQLEADDGFAGGGPDPSPPSEEEGGVEVLVQDQVGPYDYTILRATNTSDLFEWLQTNDYDIPDNVQPFVDPYVLMGEDIHFVAFKLSKGSDTGDIQPITLKYQADNPTIPIQLTAVAVQPDMPLVAYVLGETRAVPDNYLHVEINLARIDWLSGGMNYREVVTDAMNEAGGKAFTTDFAGASTILNDFFFVEGRFNRDALAASANPQAFLDLLRSQGFSGDPGLLALFEQFIPFPAALAEQGMTSRDYYNCLDCYAEYWPTDFDAAGFADAIDTQLIAPLRHAEELVDTLPYVTRLYSSLSAAEMTLDPIFVFNPDLGDVSNVHTADAIVDCTQGDGWSGPVTIRLADGRSMVMERATGGAPYAELDAAAVVQETGASGAPMVVADNRGAIAAGIETVLADRGFVVIEEPGTGGGGGTPVVTKSEDKAGCTTSPGAPSRSLVPALLVLGALVARRRRS